MFDPPGSRDPFLGAEVGKSRGRDWNWRDINAGLSAAPAETGWLALPFLVLLGLGALIAALLERVFERRR